MCRRRPSRGCTTCRALVWAATRAAARGSPGRPPSPPAGHWVRRRRSPSAHAHAAMCPMPGEHRTSTAQRPRTCRLRGRGSHPRRRPPRARCA
eukprot:2919220-Prymnesium_polylepis.1